MNIVITLPKELVQAIADGRKTIELRKTTPASFRLEEDIVYIIEKGTHLIVAQFQISYVEEINEPATIWERYSKQICVDFKWFYRYANAIRPYHLWHITKPVKYQHGIYRSYFPELRTNPQSFVYVKGKIE